MLYLIFFNLYNGIEVIHIQQKSYFKFCILIFSHRLAKCIVVFSRTGVAAVSHTTNSTEDCVAQLRCWVGSCIKCIFHLQYVIVSNAKSVGVYKHTYPIDFVLGESLPNILLQLMKVEVMLIPSTGAYTVMQHSWGLWGCLLLGMPHLLKPSGHALRSPSHTHYTPL